MSDLIDLKMQDVITERHTHLLYGRKTSANVYGVLKSFNTIKYKGYTILLKNLHATNVISYKLVSVPNPGDITETTNNEVEMDVVVEADLAGVTTIEIDRKSAEQEVRIYFKSKVADAPADVTWSIRLHPE